MEKTGYETIETLMDCVGIHNWGPNDKNHMTSWYVTSLYLDTYPSYNENGTV
jgi:hypothetical protein